MRTIDLAPDLDVGAIWAGPLARGADPQDEHDVSLGSLSIMGEDGLLANLLEGHEVHWSTLALARVYAALGASQEEAMRRLYAALDEWDVERRDDRWRDRRGDVPRIVRDVYVRRAVEQAKLAEDFEMDSSSSEELPEPEPDNVLSLYRMALVGSFPDEDVLTDGISPEEMAVIDSLSGISNDRPLTTGMPSEGATGAEAPMGRNGELVMLTPDECRDHQPTPYVVKGLIAACDVVTIVGKPGVGKTPLAVRIGYAVAQGKGVFGRRVRQGKVLYLATENDRDAMKRIGALRDRLGPADDFKLVRGTGGMFRDTFFLARLDAVIRRERPTLIVVDTLAAAMAGFKENDPEGMGEAVATMRRLTKHGAAVLVVYHDNVAGSGLPRGHGSLHADVDMNLSLVRGAGGHITGTPSKNRNGESHVSVLSYTLGVVPTGTDEDGDPITTVICQEDASPGAQEARKPRLSPTENAVLALFHQLATDGSLDPKTWQDRAIEPGVISGAKEDKSRRDVFSRAMRKLIEKRVIEHSGGGFRLVPQTSHLGEDFDDGTQS